MYTVTAQEEPAPARRPDTDAGTVPSPHSAIIDMIGAYWASRTCFAVARLGIADLLADGPKSAGRLARGLKCHEPSLFRLLRAAAGIGLLTQDGQDRFGLTAMGATLRSNVPASMRAAVIAELGEEHYEAWGEIVHTVKTGETAFHNRFSMPVWEYYARNAEAGRNFDRAMNETSELTIPGLLQVYEFSGFRKVVDVGGGNGELIAEVLRRNPEALGVLFDLPSVLDGARKRLSAEGLLERCQLTAGNFLDSVPGGGDLYLMKWVLHDWDDPNCLRILSNVRRAIAPDGRLAVIDYVIPPGSAPSFGKLVDLNMMVMSGGRERTREELRVLFALAGFELTGIALSASGMSVIEGLPV